MRFGLIGAIALGLAACGSETILRGNDRDTDGLPSGDDVRPDDLVPPIAVCAISKDPTQPGEPVSLIGENSYDPDGNLIVNYHWSLVKKPAGSEARLVSGTANIDAFTPDLVGDYAVTLTVTNDFGNPSDPCSREFRAEPAQDLYIELTSEHPTDNIALRVARSSDPEDFCSQDGCSQDWGSSGASDDPQFLSDDVTDGADVIAIGSPATGKYTITAYDDLTGKGLADNAVTVVIYVKGVEKWRGTHTMLKEFSSADFAEISFPAGSVTAL